MALVSSSALQQKTAKMFFTPAVDERPDQQKAELLEKERAAWSAESGIPQAA